MCGCLMQYTHRIENKHASYIDNIEIKKKSYLILSCCICRRLGTLGVRVGVGVIFDLLFKITMKKGDNLFCVFACLAARHYFFSFNAFMAEREDVISPADKIKSTTTMPNLILSL